MVNPNSWLEISLVVDGELAEAVAEVLARFVSGGVVLESTAVQADEGWQAEAEGGGRPVGLLRVSGYLPVDDQLEANRQRLEESLWYLGRIHPLPALEFRTLQEADWAEAWKERFQPIPIGKRLLVAPTWAEVDPAGREILRIDPGMAFGTGTHPTTQLCLELLDEILAAGQSTEDGGRKTDDGRRITDAEHIHPSSPPLPDEPLESLKGSSGLGLGVPRGFILHPSSVIDLGCGSGILAIAAVKLGAPRALAVDTDQEAVTAARQNAAANGVQDYLEIGGGSLAEILAGAYGLRRAPLVVANILAQVIIQLLGAGLDELVSPGGLLILSGILEDQAGEVVAAAEARGLRLVDQRKEGDWVALVVAP